ncbi:MULTISPECIES: metalloregulator ArsR/SmtB family transcription factor [Rhodococcus]|uniref:Iron-sulfur cluster regulator SufR n=1 Tax=Rhodococcus aetherivorans TaxID=191292 RepID=A0ABQ0YP09_9NOCA|nr:MULTISPECIES: metalloregulator ArsR/SmtB family transcription factor [Rhodococcus]MBC2587545.1 transcriptional regulator [Rhodococcus aetherivorans]NGP24483.1 transcriptional regulator [Rhodococcus aetherivorans]QIX50514.1 transcriptional regulator [Rhodococcus sp. DMU1]GES38265.1 iron-sulfur cluster regulator SufR [Rhodococcus aetherivorans]
MDRPGEFRHTGVVKTTSAARVHEERAGHTPVAAFPVTQAPGAHEGQTRAAVVQLLLEEGPITATEIGARLGLSAAGVRRHLDALIDTGEAQAAPPPRREGRGRGRPARRFQLTAVGRARLGHSYDDLASAAMRHLREVGGEAAIEDFARRRVQSILGGVPPAESGSATEIEATAEDIAAAFTDAGFAASTRRVGTGVQICQHHCPVSHVAEQFPELCEAEREAFTEILGTHVQRLATIANGDSFCTTHVPVLPPDIGKT